MEGKIVWSGASEDILGNWKGEEIIIGYIDGVTNSGEAHLRVLVATAEEMTLLLKFWVREALEWDYWLSLQYSSDWLTKQNFAYARWDLIAKLLPNATVKKAEEEAFAFFKTKRNLTAEDWDVFLHGSNEDKKRLFPGVNQGSESYQPSTYDTLANEPKEIDQQSEALSEGKLGTTAREEKMDEIKIKPSPGNVCKRFVCTICGGMTDKSFVPMIFIHPVDGQEQFVCENCIFNGPSAIKEMLLKHAADLRECANELCRLAEAKFILPTPDEIDRAYYEIARHCGYSKPFADFVAECGFEKLSQALYGPNRAG